MSKIVNHPHWNEDLWDNPAESAAIPPSDVNRRDIVITQPGGLRHDDRTDAEKLAETGLVKVNAVAGDSVFGNIVKELGEHDKRITTNTGGVSAAQGEITSTKQEVQRIKTDIIPATEAKIAEAKQALDREISQRLDLIPEGYISAYCDTTVNAGGGLLQALKHRLERPPAKRAAYPVQPDFRCVAGCTPGRGEPPRGFRQAGNLDRVHPRNSGTSSYRRPPGQLPHVE